MTLVTILLSTLATVVPLILAALGGLLSERSGIINLALEGKMLIAACVTALVSGITGNAGIGVGTGIVAAIAISLLHWLLTQKFAIDHVISGMAINLLAIGGSSYLYGAFANPIGDASIPALPSWNIGLGTAGRFTISIFLVIALLLPFVLHVYLKRTRAGLRLFAVGYDPDKARLVGVKPIEVRLLALVGTGVLTGLAGAHIVSNVGRFTNEMTAGRGYIALAALILGGWRPLPTFVACLGFSLCEAVQLQLQGTNVSGARIPSEAWQALPYVVTVIVLAGFMGRSRAPHGLGKA